MLKVAALPRAVATIAALFFTAMLAPPWVGAQALSDGSTRANDAATTAAESGGAISWNELDMAELYESAARWLLTSGPRILIILLIAYIARLVFRRVLVRIMQSKLVASGIEGRKRADTLGNVIEYTVNIAVILVALVMVLGEFGIKIGPLLAAAGVLGIAIGFGAQKIVEDVIAGFFILLEDMIRVGDVVQIADKGGLVERVNLRMVVLRDVAGNVHFIRNGEIGVITNMTKDFSRYVFDIGVAYRENTDEVIEILRQVDEEMRNDEKFKDLILEPIEILGVDGFGDSAVVIKARVKTLPIQQWAVGREFNRRIKLAFDRHDIEIPFPHQTIYFGVPKEGKAPPMNVALEESAASNRLAVAPETRAERGEASDTGDEGRNTSGTPDPDDGATEGTDR